MTKAEMHHSFAEEKCKELVEAEISLRNELFLSQRDVCDSLGLTSHGNLTLIEQHKAVPKLDRFLKILSVLGYTLEIVPKNK